MIEDKPFSASAERNREPILSVLCEYFDDRQRALEIGSGTGQHAVYFADAMPALSWQPADQQEYLDSIRRWCVDAGLANLRDPLPLDVNRETDWQGLRTASPQGYDAVYSANTLHIMSWTEVERLFEHLPAVMTDDARLAIYGPFKRCGSHTSPSNAAFDQALREAVPHRGIRDLEAVDTLARAAGLRLLDDRALPANNRCVVWQRQTG